MFDVNSISIWHVETQLRLKFQDSLQQHRQESTPAGDSGIKQPQHSEVCSCLAVCKYCEHCGGLDVHPKLFFSTTFSTKSQKESFARRCGCNRGPISNLSGFPLYQVVSYKIIVYMNTCNVMTVLILVVVYWMHELWASFRAWKPWVFPFSFCCSFNGVLWISVVLYDPASAKFNCHTGGFTFDSKKCWYTEEFMVNSTDVRYWDPVIAKQARIITSVPSCLTVVIKYLCWCCWCSVCFSNMVNEQGA